MGGTPRVPPMMHPFDEQTAVIADGPGRWRCELHAGWQVGGGLNGGYLLAVIGRALREALPGKPDPLAVSAYYCSASVAGPAEVRVDVRREGGSTATASAELVQVVEGREEVRIAALATYGDLDRLPTAVDTTATPPAMPPREECVPSTDASAGMREDVPLMSRFDLLLPPDQVGWAVGEPSGRGELGAWFRLEGGRDPDPISLLAVVDALPPVTFDLGLPGWAPTLELTVHVRARPAPGWLRVHHRTRNVAGGMFEEDAEVWDEDGRLVAQSRQLARLPRPVPTRPAAVRGAAASDEV